MRVFSARFEYFVVAVFIFHFSMLSTGICCIVYDTWEEHFHLNWHNSFNRCTCIHTMYYMHFKQQNKYFMYFKWEQNIFSFWFCKYPWCYLWLTFISPSVLPCL